MKLKIEDLRTQYLKNPAGIGTAHPKFSFLPVSQERGERQSAWQILVASKKELLNENDADLWNSKKRRGGRHCAIVYAGNPLHSRQEAFWKVRVWNRRGIVSEWSETAFFELGLLEEQDWKAVWIGQGEHFDGDKNAAPVFAGSFELREKASIKKARLYISGLGLFCGSMNGRKIAEDFFEPGESEFNRRVFYRTYDVLEFLEEGQNVLGVMLGNGQYTNYAAAPVMKKGDGTLCDTHRYQKDDSIYLKNGICGNKKLIAQLEVTRQDGSRELAAATCADGTWRWEYGPVTFQNWYGGEDYDAIRAGKLSGWDTPSRDRSGWHPAALMNPPVGKLCAREYPPVRITEIWNVKSVTALPGGRWLVDTGKNSAGFLRLQLENTEAYRGSKIELYPAEVLKPDGSGVDQASVSQSCNTLFSCCVKDSYTVAGTGTETWNPVFCYHGFQYVELAGFPGIPSADNFLACALRVANPKHSDFETDNKTLNQINQITDRSIESNMMSSFTDCPQIEKLGWLETTHLMFASMASGYDIRSWVPKIIQDMEDAQVTEDLTGENPMNLHPGDFPGFPFDRHKNTETENPGFVPGIAPEYFRINRLFRDPNWGGACIMTPWYYYQEYGDVSILREAYPMMLRYRDHLEAESSDGVLRGYAHMGEWGQINENTPTTLTVTCAFYLLTTTLAKIAGILDDRTEKNVCEDLAHRIRRGFYADPECCRREEGILGNDSQASYGCALFSGILEPAHRKRALVRLAAAVKRSDWHLTSGEVGLKQVFWVFAECGRNEIVYRMVMNPTQPGYRAFIEDGLTTLPEYWNYTELWNGFGRSRNHAMMGHVKEWLCRYVMGIRPLKPGYEKIKYQPCLVSGITWVKGSVFTVNGMASVFCSSTKQCVRMNVLVPTGSTADVYLPIPGDAEPVGILKLTEEEKGEVTLVSAPALIPGYIRIRNVVSGEHCWELRLSD